MGQTSSLCPEDAYDFKIDISHFSRNEARWPCFLSKQLLAADTQQSDMASAQACKSPEEANAANAVIAKRVEKRFMEALKDRVGVVSTIGRHKTGKTFVINQLFATQLPTNDTGQSATTSLSFKTSFTNSAAKHLILDTAGLEAPLAGKKGNIVV